MNAQTGLVTVEEFLKLPPAKGGYYELHHGEVVLMPFPVWEHEDTQDRIQMLLKGLVESKGTVRMEMSFRPTAEYEMWRADVGFVCKDRAEKVADDEYLTGAPDLVVEVLSPNCTMYELRDKMSVCMENGCSSFWVVEPKPQRVSVTEGNVTRHYNISATIYCEVIRSTVSVREIFE